MRPEILFPLFANVTTIKGVGEALAQNLVRLLHGDEHANVTLRDVLFHLPYEIIDRRNSPPLHSAPADEICTFQVKVEEHYPQGTRMCHGSKKPHRVLCSNETGDLMLVFFHAHKDQIERLLPVGSERIISGKTEKFDFRLQMTHPDIIAPVADKEKVLVVEPQYGLTAGLTNKRLRTIIAAALEKVPDLQEWRRGEPLTFKQALTQAHHPKCMEDISEDSPARQRLALDELISEQLRLKQLREQHATQEGIPLPSPNNILPPFMGGLRGEAAKNPDNIGVGKAAQGLWQQLETLLTFELTDGQRQILADISNGLASGTRYIRLLQGDVGSGKTIIALFAMLRAVENGHQAALMVPTEIVALQHFNKLSSLTAALGLRTVLLTGNVKGLERRKILEQMANGEAHIIIGTHALFQDKVTFKNLALAVIDEQHRFGVNQRMALVNKGERPHLLHMTATPIPRSLMMTQFGDMQTLILKDKPHGRKDIATRVVAASRADELLERLQAAIGRGEKAYWICPQIEETTDDEQLFARDIAAVENRYHQFQALFQGKVVLAHGRMTQEARQASMQEFYNGSSPLLVATTVIEVGVDVPDATIIIIEQAERFGLSQLHQLRGRVGRGEKESYCILLYSDNAGMDARERLLTLRNHHDGFAIAEMDYKLRGGGELLGKRQSGQKRYRIATPLQADGLLQQAHEIACGMRDEAAIILLREIFS